MFVLSRQEKIVLLLIIVGLLLFFGSKLYLQEKNSITIIPSDQAYANAGANMAKDGVTEEESCIIHIAGAVKNPGVYQLLKGKRIIDAVMIAGNITDKANLDAVNLASPLYDGQKITIPYILEGDGIHGLSNNSTNSNTMIPGYSQNNNLVNINISTARELETLDGIGDVLAERIINYRNKNGLFNKVEDIKNVPGIGEKKFNTIKEMITVH